MILNDACDAGSANRLHASAFLADHLDLIARGSNEFVLRCPLSFLSFVGMQYMRVQEEVQRVVHRSNGYMLCRAGLYQLFRRERLWESQDLLQNHVTHFGRTHLMVMHIPVKAFLRRFI